jgi:hypothetical protein
MAETKQTQSKQRTMKQQIRHLPSRRRLTNYTLAAALTLTLMGASIGSSLFAQTPCPEASVLADGLLAPSKLIQTPLGDFLVS